MKYTSGVHLLGNNYYIIMAGELRLNWYLHHLYTNDEKQLIFQVSSV